MSSGLFWSTFEIAATGSLEVAGPRDNTKAYAQTRSITSVYARSSLAEV